MGGGTGGSGLDGFARFVVLALRVLNAMLALAIVVTLACTFVYEPAWLAYYAKRHTELEAATILYRLRWWGVVGWAVFPLMHLMLTKLLAMLDTVRAGDPFVPDNARRLTQIAWLLLGLQLMHLVHGAFASSLSAVGAHVDWKFSWSGWVAVLLTFVLARVFEQGTRMRADLEGTV
ncbi:MAG TPA: DUF2975 domain-containing protein [Xanthomonadales bacterium]|nr:DUF2975 domain-containing protein [Xanthomonadales bacterium]